MERAMCKIKPKISLINIVFFLLCMLIFFLRTYGPGRHLMYSNAGLTLLSVMTFFMAFIWFVKRKKTSKKVIPLFLGLFFIVFFHWLSLLVNMNRIMPSNYSGYINNTIIQLVFVLFAAIFATFHNNNENKIDRVAFFLVVMSFISGFTAIELSLTGKTLIGQIQINNVFYLNQLSGWYTSPNTFVDTIAVGILSITFLYYNDEKRKKYKLLGFIVLLLVLMFSRSRGGIISCLFALGWLLYHINMSNQTISKCVLRFLKLIAGVFLISFVFSIIGLRIYQSEFQDISSFISWFFRSYNISSGGGRMNIWGIALDVFRENTLIELLFGRGADWFSALYERSLHNTYLQFIIENGLIFTLVFIGFQFWSVLMIKLKLKKNKHSKCIKKIAFLGSLIVYTYTRAFFQNGKVFSGDILWFLTLLSITILLVIKDSNLQKV